MAVLVTGGAGYIGSHTCIELLNLNYDVVIVDDLSNSNILAVDRIERLTNKKIKFYNANVIEEESMTNIFKDNKIDSVIHFAGFKAVGESVENPVKYYKNNLFSTINLLEKMKEFSIKKLVFSSSATVYGDPEKSPIEESAVLTTKNPYGTSKLMIEKMLIDLYNSDNEWDISILRYFNPIGAHSSGQIGENPNGIPNNLMPYITQVATGKLKEIRVFGGDYETIDGTGVRDYIHVVDLSIGHVKALEYTKKDVKIFNLGTGKGTSVLELIKCFEKTNSIKLNYKIVDRRPGDVPVYFADVNKAKTELKWEAKRNISDMCRDSWRWQKNNPEGYSY